MLVAVSYQTDIPTKAPIKLLLQVHGLLVNICLLLSHTVSLSRSQLSIPMASTNY